jgi:cysteinyl-tRNA synthetase
MLRLHDTLTGNVSPLKLREPGSVTIYACGPTVYDLPHLGHGRYVLVWDVLRRHLIASGLNVRFVSNITDIDDHIIERAAEEGRTEPEVAAQYEDEWFSAMAKLSVLRPDAVPHATEFVDQMVELIERLIAAGVAYQTSDGVYLEVAHVADYGALAGQPLESLRAGARIEAHAEKKSPLDFALWKAAKPGEPVWEASFGAGRPGWHTECVVMSLDLLGDGFDLHVGGQDLKFPHHENERAQAVALGRTFANHWGHSGWVMVGNEKMSKSLKNFTSLTDLLATSDARAYRLLCIQSHYRAPLEVTGETIAAAEVALQRLDNMARRFRLQDLDGSPVVLQNFDLDATLAAAVGQALDDDLDTPKAFATLATAVSAANAAADDGDEGRGAYLAQSVAVLLGSLGIFVKSGLNDIDAEARDLAEQRDAARKAKDWAEADRLRSELEARGYTVEDRAGETFLSR